MAFCKLNNNSLSNLYDVVFKQQLSGNAPSAIIGSVYSAVYNKGKDVDQAVTFAAAVPKAMQKAMIVDDSINKIYIKAASEIAQLRSDFEDFDAAKAYLQSIGALQEGFVPQEPIDPEEINELTLGNVSGDFVDGVFPDNTTGLNINWLSKLIDDAREAGEFVFNSITPHELEMDGKYPKEDNGKISIIPEAVRHHYVLDMLAKVIHDDSQGTESSKYKLKLELVSKENQDWFFKRDQKSSPVIAVLVNEQGDYYYFDDKGRPTAAETGYPFAVEYEDDFYAEDKIRLSRNSLGGNATSITPGFGSDRNPRNTILSMLHANMPVYGSVMAVTSGSLGTLGNNNTLATEAKSPSKMRTVKELFDSGDIREQEFDVRIEGYVLNNRKILLDYPGKRFYEQRVKVGRPSLYDVRTGLYIPLTGKKLKDVTFYGNSIPKESQLYEVIDILDTQGEVSVHTVRADKTRVFSNFDELLETFGFLQQVLYSKMFRVSLVEAGSKIVLTRNAESLKANSIWDAEINYVRTSDETRNIPIPLSNPVDDQGAPVETFISYQDFLRENFLTGVAQVKISQGDTRFAKVNKRLIFKLDKNYAKLKKDLNNGVKITKTDRPQPGDIFVPASDHTRKHKVLGMEDDMIIMVEQGDEADTEEKRISPDSLAKKWVKLDIKQQPKPIEKTSKQLATEGKIKALAPERFPGTIYRPSELAHPFIEKSEVVQSPAIVAGNAIDFVAKAIFAGKKISFSDPSSMQNVKAPIGSYFKSSTHFDEVVRVINILKNQLSQDYTFMTGVRINDPDAKASGEIDLILIDKDGVATVADFKTTKSQMTEEYLKRSYVTDGVTAGQYYSTQGYIYSLMLEKQGIPTTKNTKILGFSLTYTEGNHALDTKIVAIKDSPRYVHDFKPSDIFSGYIRESKPLSGLDQIIEVYNTLKKQTATPIKDNIENIGGRKKKDDGGLLMSIKDIQLAASTKPELQAEIDHLTKMFGEEFVVNWVNIMNTERYADWNAWGTNVYNNAIKGSIYHEGWHKFSQLFLTVPQKLKMYASVRAAGISYVDRAGVMQNTKDHDDLAIEEMLADEWVKFVNKPDSYKFPDIKVRGVITFFKKLWRLIKDWFSGTKRPLSLFKDLYTGNLKGYKKDINNAIWGKLQSSVLNDKGDEIINSTRSNLYISATSYFLGEVLRESNRSFTWLGENIREPRIKLKVYNKFVDLENDRLSKLSIPASIAPESRSAYVIDNPGVVIDATVREKGIRQELATRYVAQLMELAGILDEDRGGWENFYSFYVHNSNIDSLREAAIRSGEIAPELSSDDVRELIGESIDEEEDDEETRGTGSALQQFNEGPNDKSAFQKASKEVQDFFRTMPVVLSIRPDGTLEFLTNELDLPETYDYASVFNKTKTLLAGHFTIEDILNHLGHAEVRKYFPQAKFIHDQLVGYMERGGPENFSFIQKFIQVMDLPEVDNKELSVNYDAVDELAEGSMRTALKMKSLTRMGEDQDIRQWEYNFKTPTENRQGTALDDTITVSKIFNDTDPSNMLYNIDGVLVLNPFFNYGAIEGKIGTKEFLAIMGIEVDDRFWYNSESLDFAEKVKRFLIMNLQSYREYLDYQLTRQASSEQYKDFQNNTTLDREQIDTLLVRDYFIQNPIQQFREPRSYKLGKEGMTKDTFSIYTVLADLSRENSIYSMLATSKSFSDGAGKMKWPFYELSLIAYRTQMLNNIQNIREFDNNIEYAAINPNLNPWLQKTLFFSSIFDSRGGQRKTIAHGIRDRDDRELSSQKVIIKLADLSSFRTVDNRIYNTVHPKSLSAQDKMFFDISTMFADGYLEIPRAATSSTIMAIKLNSYDAKPKGTSFRAQYLPIEFGGVRSNLVGGKLSVTYPPLVYAIMRNYLSGELHKMLWYYRKNPSHKMANELNVFKDILDSTLTTDLVNQVRALSGTDANKLQKSIDGIVADNATAIDTAVRGFFSEYVDELYNGKGGSSILKMSKKQKKILKSISNLYVNRAKSPHEVDIAREERLALTLQERGQSSVHQGLVEKANIQYDEQLSNIAAVFAINQFILNIEYHTWYMGDNNTFSNPFKRGNLTTNTGVLGIVSPYTNTVLNESRGETMHSLLTGNTDPKDYRIVKTNTIKDVVVKSRNLDTMIKDLFNYEKSAKLYPGQTDEERLTRIGELLAPYAAVNAADGQTKIGLDAYRTFRKIFGTWSNEDEQEYRRQIAILRVHLNKYKRGEGDIINKEGIIVTRKEQDLDLIKNGPYSTFSPQKWSYTGPELILDKDGKQMSSPMRTKFDKTSLHPLLPGMLLGKGLPDEALMLDMATNDIDYVKFESAAKGAKHSDIFEYFDEFGNNKDNIKLSDAEPEWLLSSYVKRQLSTDGVYGENTYGSQQRVMLFDVKYLPEVQNNPTTLREITELEDKYLDAVQNIMTYQRAQFFNRFGLVESGSGPTYDITIGDRDRFSSALHSLAKSNNFPVNMLEALQEFAADPSMVFNKKMLFDTIGGIIDNELRRLKTKGTAAIQVTSVGNIKHPFTNPTEEQIRQYGTNGLHFYHLVYDDKGNVVKTSTMGIKITLQGDFKNLLNLKYNDKTIGNIDTLNEALKDPAFRKKHIDKLTFYAYRIPTNNNNFIDHVEVMEFVPEEAGNIVIAPMEHITKSGSDFDVDKLNFIFPSIDTKGELTSLPQEKVVTRKAYFDKQKGVEVPEVFHMNTLSIEEIYQRLNDITSSIHDYRITQKIIKSVAKVDKNNFKKLEGHRQATEVWLRQKFIELDSQTYNGLESAGATFKVMLEDLMLIAANDDEVIGNIDNFKRITDKLDNFQGITERKLDPTFSRLLKNLSAYKDYYTNEMLAAEKAVLSHPAYFQIIIAPSNAKYLEGEATRIGNLVGKKNVENLSATQNTKYTTVNAIHGNYMADSKHLGMYAIQRKWYSLLNFSRMELNRDWSYHTKAGKNQMRIHTPLAPDDKIGLIADGEVIKLYGDNIDNMSPRDIWDQLMTLTIDLPNNPVYTLAGINNHNRKIVQYLIISRYSIPDILNFINQPILQEVYDNYAKKSKDITGYTIKHSLYEIAKRMGIKGEGFDEAYLNLYEVDDNGIQLPRANVYVKNPAIFATQMLTSNDKFESTDMLKDLSATAEDKQLSDYKERQRKILLYYMNVALEATNFMGMQFTYSEDRVKNINYYTIHENDQKKEDFRGSRFDNLPVQGSMFSKDALLRLEDKSIYSMFSYSEVAKIFYEEFAEKFTDFDVATEFKKILNSTSTFGTDRQVLANRIEGDFVEFIYKNFARFDIDIYDPFEDKISKSEDSFGNYFIQGIFNIKRNPDHKTYASKLNKFLQKYPELEQRIEFIQKLKPQGILAKNPDGKVPLNPFDTFSANVIRFNRSQENTVQERNFFAHQLENLINFNPIEFKLSKDYSQDDINKISAFFTELAHLSLYQAGPTNIADNFSDLIPAKMWSSFIKDAFENYNNAVGGTVSQRLAGTAPASKISKHDLLRMFHMMYRENNPKVKWSRINMMYHIRYFDQDIQSLGLSKKEKSFIYKNYNRPTEFFLNFTAGKMYDLKRFANSIDFKVVDNLC